MDDLEKQESFDKRENFDRKDRDEIFSQSVRAGKRTYFFDVKATRKNDYYLTITESKKRFNKDGRYFFEKHKIFLYKEDFDKFQEGMEQAIEFIKKNQPELEEDFRESDFPEKEYQEEVAELVDANHAEDYTNVEFEDLGEK